MDLILPRNLHKVRYIGHKIIKILKILSDGKEEIKGLVPMKVEEHNEKARPLFALEYPHIRVRLD
jgi:hypothetical protein